MWLKAQNEMAGLWPRAAMGPVERMVRPHMNFSSFADTIPSTIVPIDPRTNRK